MRADELDVLGPVVPPAKRGRPPKPKTETLGHKPRNRGPTTDPKYLAEKIRLANAQAVKVELQNAAARRELVPAAQVEKEWSAILRDVGPASWPPRAAFKLGFRISRRTTFR